MSVINLIINYETTFARALIIADNHFNIDFHVLDPSRLILRAFQMKITRLPFNERLGRIFFCFQRHFGMNDHTRSPTKLKPKKTYLPLACFVC